MALEQVTHKPVCWFCYVVDNFVISPQRPEKLERFLDHSTGVHQTIHFTMEILICTGPWMAHRATRFTENLLILTPNLNSKSHCHPFNKHSVLSTLGHRARVGVTQTVYLMSWSS
jgi:hypothetical protein